MFPYASVSDERANSSAMAVDRRCTDTVNVPSFRKCPVCPYLDSILMAIAPCSDPQWGSSNLWGCEEQTLLL